MGRVEAGSFHTAPRGSYKLPKPLGSGVGAAWETSASNCPPVTDFDRPHGGA